MKDNFHFIVGLGGLIFGLVGIGYAIGSRKRVNDICGKLDTTIDKISQDIEVDISDKILNEAVEKAVDREIRLVVGRASNKVCEEIRNDINAKVRGVVDVMYPDISNAITDKVAFEVSKINVKALKDTIREDAREKVVAKIDGQLDDILDQFNTEIKILKTVLYER